MPQASPPPKRVLVVDDIPEIASLVRGALGRLRDIPLEITLEVNAQRARELAQREAFDLIICDFRMREANGLQVLGDARARHPEGLRVLMTGYHELPATREHIQDARVDSYLTKPIQTQELLFILSGMLTGDEALLADQRALAREAERAMLGRDT